MFGDSSPFVRLKVFEENMRSVIKRRREAGDHRSSTPRLGSQPSRSVLSRRRRNPSVVGLPSYGFIRSPSAFVAAVPSLRSKLRSVTLATRSRRRPRPSLSGLLWLANSEVSGACCRTPPAPRLWGSLPRLLFLLHAIPPGFSSSTKKGRRRRLPSGVQNVTLPTRARRFRAWTIPTHAPPP